MRVLTVIGARPQFIKAAVVSREISSRAELSEYILHTGQHYDDNLSSIFFEELSIPEPYRNLAIGSSSHAKQTAQMLIGIEKAIVDLKPDCVLLYGDTNSTLAGALAASKMQIPVIHVEAGLRSFNRGMPEEVNRIVTDHVSDLLFAPTSTAHSRLKEEGVEGDRVVLSGDVMLDAAKLFFSQSSSMEILEQHGVERKNFVLVTVHRAENTDDQERIGRICSELKGLSKNMFLLWPVHPRTRKCLNDVSLDEARIRLIQPVGFVEMAALEEAAACIVTDSGGVQKEAYFHGTPCVTLREESEWTELQKSGWNQLYPPISANEKPLSLVVESLIKRCEGAVQEELYGDGHAAALIVDAMIRRYI